MKKVAVIGAGNVGATTAYYVARENLADIALVDVVAGLPQSKALDFSHVSALHHSSISITGDTEYEAISGADVVVFTAGIARKPGMDRMDLLKTNVKIAKTAATQIARYAPDSVVIVVTNPLDVISMVVLRESGFTGGRIVGMAGVLDATRFQYFVAEACDVWPGDVAAMVLGGHGDSMVPLKRYTSVSGIPVTELLDEETVNRLVERTRKGGAEIVNFLKTGSAYYAPGASAAKMVKSVLLDEKKLLPASVYLQGEYGFKGIFLGVPIIIGAGGVERIPEIDLSEDEQTALRKSAEAVQEGLALLEKI